MWMEPEFADRREAGRRLAAALGRYKGPATLVLALPRGGVPVAFEVARALGAELDLVIARKIGAPFQEELGIGAIVGGPSPELVIDRRLADMVGASAGYIERKASEELAEIERRKRAYRGDQPDPQIRGRTVIVVDDGIATGSTMKAALRALRRGRPARLVMAVPVAPAESLTELEAECDEVVCLERPSWFAAVGNHYSDFLQTSDDEVIRLLAEAREPAGTAS